MSVVPKFWDKVGQFEKKKFFFWKLFKNCLNFQLELIQAIWHVWSRLYKLSTSAIGKRRQICEDKMLMISHGSEYTVMDLTKIEFDFSWCTKYTNEQMQQWVGIIVKIEKIEETNFFFRNFFFEFFLRVIFCTF